LKEILLKLDEKTRNEYVANMARFMIEEMDSQIAAKAALAATPSTEGASVGPDGCMYHTTPESASELGYCDTNSMCGTVLHVHGKKCKNWKSAKEKEPVLGTCPVQNEPHMKCSSDRWKPLS